MSGANEATLHFDGGSRGNPGPAAGGYVLEFGEKRVEGGEFFGTDLTNNEAEYRALILGLHEAMSVAGVDNINIQGDSLLVIRQTNGDWDCNAVNLQPHLDTVHNLLGKQFNHWDIQHVDRAENDTADGLVNDFLDHKGTPPRLQSDA